MKRIRALTREFILSRQRNYKVTFGGAAGKEVLKDLARFCRARDSIFDNSPERTAYLAGRRDVFLRIAKNVELSGDQLWDFEKSQALEERTTNV